MSRSQEPDWQRIAHESTGRPGEGGLSEEDGVALEARVSVDGSDVDARVRLVGFYFLRFTPEDHRRRAEHVAWLAEHHPEIGLGGYGSVVEELAPVGYDAARRAWRAAVARPDADVRVLENAASFLQLGHPEEAEALLRRAAAREPTSYRWRTAIAWNLFRRAAEAEEPGQRRAHARAAIAELAQALELTSTDRELLDIRLDLTRVAVQAEDWELVREVAERVLRENETCERTFQYGNAIHWPNIALGHAAMAHDDLASAAEYLVRAGKTPGSPQLNSFGPDRDLARAILQRGERPAVLTYLADCARFWSGREALLAKWRDAIARGEPTELEPS